MAVLTGALSSINASLAIQTDALNSGIAAFDVSGVFTGTINFQATINGTNWFNVAAMPAAGGQSSQTAAAPGQFFVATQGYNQVRAFMSAFTSGSAVVSADTSLGTLPGAPTANGGGGADSTQSSGTSVAPGAGGVIVAAITPGPGTWLVQAATAIGAGVPVAADVGNMQLMKNAGVLSKLTAAINASSLNPPIRVTLIAGDTLSIQAIGAATAGVAYNATLVATKVG